MNFDKEKIVHHVQAKMGDGNCPLCQRNNWGVLDSLYELRQYNEDPAALQHVIIVATARCKNCGNTILIDAAVAGLI